MSSKAKTESKFLTQSELHFAVAVGALNTLEDENLLNISTCIATYNAEKYIIDQLDSILSQELPVDEIVVSDDSSTDSTLDIINSYKEDRIKLIENEGIKGPVFNFENALKHTTGDLIFLSDQDDIWLPKKTKIMTSYLSSYDLVVSDAMLIDGSGSFLGDSFFELRNSRAGFLKNLYKNSYLGCCMAFNRKILEKSLPFPADIPMHDMWIGLIAEIWGSTFFCDEKLVYYRRHSTNASPAGRKSHYSLLVKIIFRFNLIISLIKRCSQWRNYRCG